MQTWEYGIVVVTKLPSAPTGLGNPAPKSVAYIVTDDRATLYGVGTSWVGALNRAGADGWIEYRREYQTNADWLAWLQQVVDVDAAVGYAIGPARSNTEFWVRRERNSG